MSPGMKKVLLWAAIIWLISYLFAINPVTAAKNTWHGVQNTHNSSVTNGAGGGAP